MRHLVVAGSVGLLCLACGSGQDAPAGAPDATASSPPPDVVWIAIDGLRADHSTPTLERLAAVGHRFPNLFAHSPSVLPAHVAALSSRHPVESEVWRNGQVVPEALPLLPAWLAEHGYRTAAVVADAELWPSEPGLGLDRAFERFEHLEREVADAEMVLGRALELLDELDGSEPFFLFAQFADPGPPLRAHGTSTETAELLVDGAAELSFPVVEDGWWSGQLSLPKGNHLIQVKSILPLDVRYLRASLEPGEGGGPRFYFIAESGTDALSVTNVSTDRRDFLIELRAHDVPDAATARQRYELEVEHADRAVGALLEALERRGLYDEALVLVTAATGLELGERDGFVGRDRHLAPAVLRVPFVLKPPAGHPLGGELERARDKLLRQIDIAPTVLELLDLPPLPGQVGSSVTVGTLRLVLAEAHPPAATENLFSLRDDSVELVLRADPGSPDKRRFEMYDPSTDPERSHDVFAERGGERAEWRTALLGTATRFDRVAAGVNPASGDE